MAVITLTPEEKAMSIHVLSHPSNNAHVREIGQWVMQDPSLEMDTLTAALVYHIAREVCKCDKCYWTDEFSSLGNKRYWAHKNVS
jgi:phage gp46-like protein